MGPREPARLSIATIKCQHWTLALLPRPSCYVGYYYTDKDKDKDKDVCDAKKLRGLKTLLFEPRPRLERLPTCVVAQPRCTRRGFGVSHPHHRDDHGWKLYQAGIHENRLGTKPSSGSPLSVPTDHMNTVSSTYSAKT